MPLFGGDVTKWDNACLARPIEKIEVQISSLVTVPVVRFTW